MIGTQVKIFGLEYVVDYFGVDELIASPNCCTHPASAVDNYPFIGILWEARDLDGFQLSLGREALRKCSNRLIVVEDPRIVWIWDRVRDANFQRSTVGCDRPFLWPSRGNAARDVVRKYVCCFTMSDFDDIGSG
ncbi:hypothetical protein WK59_28645 [Burkholderia ubonensis]|nr:hypothetical protein WK59_28645 [Burkholderia ubonensis]